MPAIKIDLKPEVLGELERHGIIERACRAVGITSETLRRWRRQDRQFNRDVKRALKIGRA